MGKRNRLPACRLGIDLGGTKMHAVVIDPKGKVLASARRPTKSEAGYKAVLKRLLTTAEEALAGLDLDLHAVSAVGLGMPGPIDDRHGVVHLAPNLGWREKAVAEDLGELMKRPVILGNDVNFGCLGEFAHGAAKGAGSAFAAFVGTGLGGGLVLDDRLHNGIHGFAGEIGHIPAPFGDAPCGCGLKGCLETVASKTGISRLIAGRRAAGERCLIELGKDDRLKSSQLRQAWKDGCRCTRRAVKDACRALGWGLAMVGSVVDPEVFILGGGVMEAMGDELLPLVRDGLSEFSMSYRERSADLRLAALGDDAVAIGAAVASCPEES
jgi:glucokinase